MSNYGSKHAAFSLFKKSARQGKWKYLLDEEGQEKYPKITKFQWIAFGFLLGAPIVQPFIFKLISLK